MTFEVARLKAFMYALRYGEGTLEYKGYKTIVGGGTFDDFSKHPKKVLRLNALTQIKRNIPQFIQPQLVHINSYLQLGMAFNLNMVKNTISMTFRLKIKTRAV